jgi:hypothetical protein
VSVVEPSERTLLVTLRTAGTDFKLKTPADRVVRPGDRAQARFDLTRLYLFDPATGLALDRAGSTTRAATHDGIAAR